MLFLGKTDNSIEISTKIGHFFAKGPNTLVNYFKSSDKQLAFLRDYMQILYRKIQALIAIVLTR
jgi:hypothetical protein